MISRQGGGGSFNLLNAIAAIFGLIFRHCGVPEVLHYGVMFNFLRYCRLNPQSHKSSLFNNPKAGLLRCNAPRNDDETIARCRVGKAQAFPLKKHRTTTPNPSPLERGNAAFTLAEVLITLGIIGVVAAMTLPTLIQKNNNRVVETRLQKFYSNINQAVQMAEVQYGDKKIWFEDLTGAQLDENGKPIEGSSKSEKWFNKYLAPHLKIIKKEILSDGSFIVYFPDGSALRAMPHTTRDWMFYPGNPQKCIKTYGVEFEIISGVCSFIFNFNPSNNHPDWKYHYNKGFEPYKYYWDGTKEKLYEGDNLSCRDTTRAFCAALIQYNGWKIPDDYPYKVSY